MWRWTEARPGLKSKVKEPKTTDKGISDKFLPIGVCLRLNVLPPFGPCNSTIPLIASGGLKNGLDLAKSIALGADLGGLARPFLVAAIESEAAVDELVKFLIAELEIVLFLHRKY
jgi:hypothetical protein